MSAPTSNQFSNVELDKLCNDPEKTSVFRERRKKLFYLHPYHLRDLRSGVRDALQEALSKYDSDFRGILVGYKKVQVHSDVGAISADNSFAEILLEADFYCFKPAVGSRLTGVVHKRSEDLIGCLTLGRFNVACPREEHLTGDSEQESLCNWPGSRVNLGQEITVQVTKVELQSSLPYLRGRIIDIPGWEGEIPEQDQEELDSGFGGRDTSVDRDTIPDSDDMIAKKQIKKAGQVNLDIPEKPKKKVKTTVEVATTPDNRSVVSPVTGEIKKKKVRISKLSLSQKQDDTDSESVFKETKRPKLSICPPEFTNFLQCHSTPKSDSLIVVQRPDLPDSVVNPLSPMLFDSQKSQSSPTRRTGFPFKAHSSASMASESSDNEAATVENINENLKSPPLSQKGAAHPSSSSEDEEETPKLPATLVKAAPTSKKLPPAVKLQEDSGSESDTEDSSAEPSPKVPPHSQNSQKIKPSVQKKSSSGSESYEDSSGDDKSKPQVKTTPAPSQGARKPSPGKKQQESSSEEDSSDNNKGKPQVKSASTPSQGAPKANPAKEQEESSSEEDESDEKPNLAKQTPKLNPKVNSTTKTTQKKKEASSEEESSEDEEPTSAQQTNKPAVKTPAKPPVKPQPSSAAKKQVSESDSDESSEEEKPPPKPAPKTAPVKNTKKKGSEASDSSSDEEEEKSSKQIASKTAPAKKPEVKPVPKPPVKATKESSSDSESSSDDAKNEKVPSAKPNNKKKSSSGSDESDKEIKKTPLAGKVTQKSVAVRKESSDYDSSSTYEKSKSPKAKSSSESESEEEAAPKTPTSQFKVPPASKKPTIASPEKRQTSISSVGENGAKKSKLSQAKSSDSNEDDLSFVSATPGKKSCEELKKLKAQEFLASLMKGTNSSFTAYDFVEKLKATVQLEDPLIHRRKKFTKTRPKSPQANSTLNDQLDVSIVEENIRNSVMATVQRMFKEFEAKQSSTDSEQKGPSVTPTVSSPAKKLPAVTAKSLPAKKKSEDDSSSDEEKPPEKLSSPVKKMPAVTAKSLPAKKKSEDDSSSDEEKRPAKLSSPIKKSAPLTPLKTKPTTKVAASKSTTIVEVKEKPSEIKKKGIKSVMETEGPVLNESVTELLLKAAEKKLGVGPTKKPDPSASSDEAPQVKSPAKAPAKPSKKKKATSKVEDSKSTNQEDLIKSLMMTATSMTKIPDKSKSKTKSKPAEDDTETQKEKSKIKSKSKTADVNIEDLTKKLLQDATQAVTLSEPKKDKRRKVEASEEIPKKKSKKSKTKEAAPSKNDFNQAAQAFLKQKQK